MVKAKPNGKVQVKTYIDYDRLIEQIDQADAALRDWIAAQFVELRGQIDDAFSTPLDLKNTIAVGGDEDAETPGST